MRNPDAVLLSHLHADHTHLPSLRLLDPDVPIVAPWRAIDGLPALRRFADRLVPLRPGDETRIGTLTVRAVPARHDGRRWRRGPELAPAIGYVVEGDRRTYFAGDTDLYPDLADHVGPVDLALLPVGGWGPTLGNGHLDPSRAAVVARLVAAGLAVPIHYGTLWPIGLDAVRPGCSSVRAPNSSTTPSGRGSSRWNCPGWRTRRTGRRPRFAGTTPRMNSATSAHRMP